MSVASKMRNGVDSSNDEIEQRSTAERRRVGGRPSYKPTLEHEGIVRALSAFGLPLHGIADYLRIDPKTLSKYYEEQVRNSRVALLAKATSNVAKALNSSNDDRAYSAAKFVLSTVGKKFGWSESFGDPGGPDPFGGLDMTKLSHVDFNQLLDIIEKTGVSIRELSTAYTLNLPPRKNEDEDKS